MSINEIELIVDGKPFGKQRPKFARMGGFVKVYTPKETIEKEAEIQSVFKQKYPNHKPFENATSFSVIAYMAIPKSTSKIKKQQMLNNEIKAVIKPDGDNIGKLALDALNGLAYTDDNHVVIFNVEKRYSENPRIEIMIREI